MKNLLKIFVFLLFFTTIKCVSLTGYKNVENVDLGGQLALVEGGAVYLIDLGKGTPKTNIIESKKPIETLEWMKGGKELIYSFSVNGKNQIYTYNIERKKSEQLFSDIQGHSILPSPDGKKILYSALTDLKTYEFGNYIIKKPVYEWFIKESGSNDLITFKDDTPHEDTDYMNEIENIAWSPSGEKIAFYKKRMLSPNYPGYRRKWGVYISNPDGSDSRLIIKGEFYSSEVQKIVWSSDERGLFLPTFKPINWEGSIATELLFAKTSDWGLWYVDLDGKKENKAHGITFTSLYKFGTPYEFENFSISRDNQKAMFQNRGNLFFMDLKQKIYQLVPEGKNIIIFKWYANNDT